MLLLLIAQQLDEALGLSNLTKQLNQYLPAEQVASSLVTLTQQLPATFVQPTPTAMLVWAMAAVMLLAVLEQVKYQIGRFGKGGTQLPGGCCCWQQAAERAQRIYDIPHEQQLTGQALTDACTRREAQTEAGTTAVVSGTHDVQRGVWVPSSVPALLPVRAPAPAGPSYTVPFLGSIVEMVQDPHAFWERQRAYSFPGLSWNSIVTKFTVMVTDPSVIRHVFAHNR